MKNWEQYIFEEDDYATEQILLGSNYAGRAINIAQTTAPHAFSYKLTSLYGISHGHAVAICLPVIWRYMIANIDKCIDKRGSKYLSKIFHEIAGCMGSVSPEQASVEFCHMIKQMDLDNPVIKKNEDIELIAHSVNILRLKNNPVLLDEIDIKNCIIGKDQTCQSSIVFDNNATKLDVINKLD
jgi:alcohol dehydrogenase class IV